MLSTGYLRQLLSEAINDASIILGIEEKAKEQRFITNEIVQSGGHPLFSGCTDIYKYSEMIKVYASEKFNDQTIIKATIMEPYYLTKRSNPRTKELKQITQKIPSWRWAEPNNNPVNEIEISYIRTREPILKKIANKKTRDPRIGKMIVVKNWDTLVKTYGLDKEGYLKAPVPFHKSWNWLCEEPLVITGIKDKIIGTASGYLNGSPCVCEEIIDKYLPDDPLPKIKKTGDDIIKIPDTITHTSHTIIENALFQKPNAKTLILGNNTRVIRKNLFEGFDFNKIIIPNSVKHICPRAFNKITSEVVWGDNPEITEIGSYAFDGYKGKELAVPDSVTHIGFAGIRADEKTKIHMSKNIKYFGEHATNNENKQQTIKEKGVFLIKFKKNENGTISPTQSSGARNDCFFEKEQFEKTKRLAVEAKAQSPELFKDISDMLYWTGWDADKDVIYLVEAYDENTKEPSLYEPAYCNKFKSVKEIEPKEIHELFYDGKYVK